MNIVQLNKFIEHISLHIPIVNSFYTESVYDCWNTDEVKYGSVVFGVKSSNNGNYSCVLYYGDRLVEDGSNRDAVFSDAVDVINAVLGVLDNSDNVVRVTSKQITFFEQQFSDNLAGAYANVVINIGESGEDCGFLDMQNGEIVLPPIGNILDNYYTKTEIDRKLDELVISGEIDLSNYYTKNESNNRFQPKGNYLTSIPSQYITESELNSKNYATKSELNGFATVSYVDGLVGDIATVLDNILND